MEKTIAVIVTYNRRQLLSECITALRNQTQQLDAILVVNNGSTDDTEQWLQAQHDVVFVTQKNIGSSGGFNTGINWAYKNGYSWIWCMDDDGYPKEDALEQILSPTTDRLCLRNCAVINKTDKKSFVWKTKNYATIDDVDTNIIKGIGHPFNGTMIHRNIVERVGTPKPKLFLWGDETEYYYRITKKNNIPVVTIANSIHYHPASAFSYKQDWDYKNTWKMYFYVRNRLHIHKAKFNNKAIALFNYCCFLVAMVGVILFFQKTDKFKKLGFLIWPAFDAFRNNFAETPKHILYRLSIHPITVLANVLNKTVNYAFEYMIAPFTVFKQRRAINA
jgi:rhamnopyranosyl-N-acetylglucosaminyl-diphospho-decaprenol beta-1,3/1,4-galactofuranosyltransferase